MPPRRRFDLDADFDTTDYDTTPIVEFVLRRRLGDSSPGLRVVEAAMFAPRSDQDGLRPVQLKALKAVLAYGANPAAIEKPLDQSVVNEHRRFDCASYSACLDLACALDWRSFSCTRCPRAGGEGQTNTTSDSMKVRLEAGATARVG